ncbi:MAG: four helix bundle protein [Bacteroidetes bacterium 4484_249]|nr:MAG: four helix bundle protein [Bacteroidetes bacterium 4484_249]
MSQFRFENLDIWKMAIEISDQLFDIADELEKMKRFRFADQLYGAGMSISNNISEGSGSFSNKDFANFLKFSRRSVFECANIVYIVERRSIITKELKENLYNKLEHLSRKITNFRKTLL